MKSRSFPAMNMGMALLITIFVVLCLVTFAALSLVSAQKDHDSSEKLAESTTAYYKAGNLAYAKMEEIDEIVASAHQKAVDWNRVRQALPEDVTFAGETKTAAFSISVNENKTLEVTLQLLEKKSGGKWYRITGWKEAAQNNWQGDDRLPVMQHIG